MTVSNRIENRQTVARQDVWYRVSESFLITMGIKYGDFANGPHFLEFKCEFVTLSLAAAKSELIYQPMMTAESLVILIVIFFIQIISHFVLTIYYSGLQLRRQPICNASLLTRFLSKLTLISMAIVRSPDRPTKGISHRYHIHMLSQIMYIGTNPFGGVILNGLKKRTRQGPLLGTCKGYRIKLKSKHHILASMILKDKVRMSAKKKARTRNRTTTSGKKYFLPLFIPLQ
jgi:hypothetical protein